tara:strand:- start:1592 stop:1975 length:384 start_codon:yes stop_codon:yes gene_type:complete
MNPDSPQHDDVYLLRNGENTVSFRRFNKQMTDGTYEVVEITTTDSKGTISRYILKIEKAREKWKELVKDGWTFDETKRKHDEFLRKCNHSFTRNQKVMKSISDSMEAYVKKKKLRYTDNWDNYALEA